MNDELLKKYDNLSVDNKVGFLEKGHRYERVGQEDFTYNSVTTLIKDYKNNFDAITVAKKKVKDVDSEYFGEDSEEVVKKWQHYAKLKSDEGTALHAYGEDVLNNKSDIVVPSLKKAKWVPIIVDRLHKEGYALARTELLVYSDILNIAGQSDIILKKEVDGEIFFMIYDWKFLSKKLSRKSFYNAYAKRYKKMMGPFKHLMDCNWIHYSIQLAIYQTLTGDPNRIKEKVLVVVYDDGYELVPAYPMRVFWDENKELQAVYEVYNGKFYDSRTDESYNTWPSDIKGR
jgi:hypothetical protein